MSTEMVIATQDGRKTQTRRVLTKQNSIVGEGRVNWPGFCWDGSAIYFDTCHHGHTEKIKAPLPFIDGRSNYRYLHVPYRFAEECTIYRIYPKWDVGDRLWVKETWTTDWHTVGNDYEPDVVYKASPPPDYVTVERWRPSIYMPRWASRITLEITGIRAERVQDISIRHDDCMKEGWPFGFQVETLNESPIVTFARYWDSINAKRGYSWESNPWVWVIEFKIVEEETKW